MKRIIATGVALSAVMVSTTTWADEDDATDFDHDWRFRGRIQIDAASFDGGDPMLQDSSAVRRARLALAGDLSERWSAKLEYELTGSTPGPKSIWLRRKLGERGDLTLGNVKIPLGLQNATSSRYSTFMERALPHTFSPGYRLGARYRTSGKGWSSAFGLFGGELTDDHRHDTDGIGFFARGVMNPIAKKSKLLHLGVSFERRQHDTGNSLRLRYRPEADLTSERLVDTGRINDLDASTRYAVEFAAKRGALNLQGEYIAMNVSRTTGASLAFSGWYAQTSWFITGERRKYNERTGSFARTKPDHSYGAWEVALRRSELDLSDTDIEGGQEKNTTFALNWYATDRIRVSVNYVDASAAPNSSNVNQDLDVIEGRFQFIF